MLTEVSNRAPCGDGDCRGCPTCNGYRAQLDIDDYPTETALLFDLDAQGFDATTIEIAATMYRETYPNG